MCSIQTDLLETLFVKWLIVAGEKSYTVKAKLGEGGYAKVYHIVETSAKNDEGNAIVAKVYEFNI